MEKRKFNSLIIFDSALHVASSRGVDTVYGVLYDSRRHISKDTILNFVKYVAGTRKWGACGNEIDENKNWVSMDGTKKVVYGMTDEFVKKWSEKAYKENPIAYYCYESTEDISYNEDEINGSYIVSEELWNRLKEKLKEC